MACADGRRNAGAGFAHSGEPLVRFAAALSRYYRAAMPDVARHGIAIGGGVSALAARWAGTALRRCVRGCARSCLWSLARSPLFPGVTDGIRSEACPTGDRNG